jgi:hypothetical protein
MGVYRYIVRKTKPATLILQGGQKVKAHRFTFFCRENDLDTFCFSEWVRKRANVLQMRLAHTHSAWGNAVPEYIVYADNESGEVSEGGSVYANPGCVSWHDAGKQPGTFVGYAYREGNQLKVYTQEKVCQTGITSL